MSPLKALITWILLGTLENALAGPPLQVSFDLHQRAGARAQQIYRPDMLSRHFLHYNLLMAPNSDRSLFFIKLYFSENKIPVDVAIDTGSSILWIFERSCLNSKKVQICGAPLRDIFYGYLDGGIQGIIIKTDVYLNNETANRDVDVMLTQSANKLVGEPILGLGPKTSEYPTFLDKLKINGLIDRRVFTMDIAHQKLIFGDLESQHSLIRVPMRSYSTYQILIDEIAFLGESITNRSIDGIVDSGNTLIALPNHLKSRMLSILRQKGLECTTQLEDNESFANLFCLLPLNEINGDLDFFINGYKFSVGRKDLIQECELGIGKRRCKSGIEFHDFSYGIILGQPFIKKYRATFDLDKWEIGFDVSQDKAAVIL